MKFLEFMMILAVWTLVRSAAGGTAEHRILEFAAEAAMEQETQLGITQDSESETGREGQDGTDLTETDDISETERPETETEADTEAGTETETGTEPGTETETEISTESGTEMETEIGTEPGTETETETGTEPGTETETGSESETETETETASESEMETESREILVSGLRVACENESRYYDGTAEVPLEAEITGLPEGMTLELQGVSASGDVGVWPVEVQAVLEGENSEAYQVMFETTQGGETEEPLTVTILPRPLRVELSDAKKPYYSDNLEKNLIFEEEMPVFVSGFMENGQETDEIPEGFELPGISIDETVLQKDSPMYRNGVEMEYENALILSTDEKGDYTGNPTENYCFTMESEEYFRGGTVVLSAPVLVGTLDYTIECTTGASWLDAQGRFWIREGGSIQIKPTQGKGFTEGAGFFSLTASGEGEFRLTKRNAAGELLAESQTRSIRWYTDGQAPSGGLCVNGASISETDNLTLSGTAEVKISDLTDSQSGLCSVQMLAAPGTQAEQTGKSLYDADPSAWTTQSSCLLTEEGTWQVFARLEDRVGNVQYLKSGSILIDKSTPQIRITGIKPGSANNGTVALEVILEDTNLDEGQVQLILRGSKNGERQMQWQREEGEGKLCFRLDDLPHSREWDDLYTLSVQAADQAGNQTEETLRFSVNRFGSVLEIDKKTKEGIAGYYLQTPHAVVIREVNVDDLTVTRITVGYEGKIRLLRPGRDYQVEKRGTANTWKEYCYRIPASVFQQEGRYYVLCSSRDRASNETDNRLQKQKLEFAIDRTAPSLIVTGVENQGVYDGDTRKLYLECRDNLALKQVTAWRGEELLCSNNQEEQEFSLSSENDWQELRFLAVDRAGNAAEEQKIWFWLGNREPDPLPMEAKGQERREILEAETGGMETETALISSEWKEKERGSMDTKKTESEGTKFKIPAKIAAGVAFITVFVVILCRLRAVKL